jgi:alpha,alpha-trehalase
MLLDTKTTQSVKQFISDHWQETVRRPEHQGPDEVPLVAPFTVPTAGPTFRLLFYWDTYFTCEGLFRSGQSELARSNADNFIHLIETLGYVPNYNLTRDLNRTQPPVASLLFRAVYEHDGDTSWLARAYRACEREYAFWMANRCFPGGLNHYGQHLPAAELLQVSPGSGGRVVNAPSDYVDRVLFDAHHYAECESGWDFCPRFDSRCMDYAPVDLNSLLYAYEINQAWFCSQLGLPGSETWQARAARRKALMDRLCWQASEGFYYDYDMKHQRPAPVRSAAAYFTLWCGVASQEQAAQMAAALARLEAPFGLDTCQPGPRPPGQVYQWDTPNAWPPLQFAAIAGLLRYGFEEHARRLATKYIATVNQTFVHTGNLWEKYNAHTGGIDVANEYAMPAMLGWTAGTYLYACEVAGFL